MNDPSANSKKLSLCSTMNTSSEKLGEKWLRLPVRRQLID
jgi:hypothetical protein